MIATSFTEAKKTGRVWLVVMGNRMRPAALNGFNPFVRGTKDV